MVRYKKKVNKGLIVLSQGETIGMMTMLAIIAVLLAFSVFRPVVQLTKRDRMAFHRLDSMLALQENDRNETARTDPDMNTERSNLINRKVYEDNSSRKYHSEESFSGNYPSGNSSSRNYGSGNYPSGNSSSKNYGSGNYPSGNSSSRNYGSGKSYSERNTGENHTTGRTSTVKKPANVRAPVMEVIDINIADSTTLLDLPQIGAVMSSRIQRYRERLGGFVAMEQLYEIKGMDTARYEVIQPYITLGEHELRKLRVNSDDFKVLLRHPYLEYDQVKAIVNHRDRRGLITNWQQLHSLLPDCNPLLEHYIDYQ